MELWEIIKDLRVKAGLTQKAFADKLGYTAMHISAIERSPDEGGRLPSEDLLKKIARKFTDNEAERIELERRLLLARAKQVVPQEVAGIFMEGKVVLTTEAMPQGFIARLKTDLRSVRDPDVFYRSLTVPRETVEAALRGECALIRKSVVELAAKLGQSVDEYLTLSGYMPEEVKLLVEHEGVANVLRSLSSLTHDELDAVASTISAMVRGFLSARVKPSCKDPGTA